MPEQNPAATWTPPAELGLSPATIAVVHDVATQLHTDPAEVYSMLEGIERGESRAEYFGFTQEVQASLETMALAYYRGQRYSDARSIFRLLLTVTDGTNAAAWRGAAACDQAEQHYENAIVGFRHALALQPQDDHSAVYLGECLCLIGERQTGLQVLRDVLQQHAGQSASKPHLVRAQTIIKMNGGIAQATSNKRPAASASASDSPSTPPVESAKSDIHDFAAGWDAALAQDKVSDPDVQRLLDDPSTRAQLDTLALAVQNGQMTIRQIADFTQEQMDAGYAVACQLLERGEPFKAAEMAGWMLWIDKRDTRFYRLAGLCAHHLKLWCLADFLYTVVGIWREGGADAATLIYQGEVKLMQEERVEGMALLTRGITLAGDDRALSEITKRGKLLLKQIEQQSAPRP